MQVFGIDGGRDQDLLADAEMKPAGEEQRADGGRPQNQALAAGPLRYPRIKSFTVPKLRRLRAVRLRANCATGPVEMLRVGIQGKLSNELMTVVGSSGIKGRFIAIVTAIVIAIVITTSQT